MSPHSPLWYYLWLAPHGLQLVIGVMLIRRKLFREFPVFMAYTVFQVAKTGTLFVLDHSDSVSAEQYWNAYLPGLIVSIVLRFALIQEIFSHVFRPYPAIGQLGRVLFRWAAVVLLLVGVAVAAYSPGTDMERAMSGIYVLSRTISLVQCGLLALLFLFSSHFRLSWRSYVLGIAVGLGTFSSVDLATAAIQVWSGPAAGIHVLLDFVTMGTYHCSVLIWLFYILAPEPAQATVKQLPDVDLEKWNTELQRLLMQ